MEIKATIRLHQAQNAVEGDFYFPNYCARWAVTSNRRPVFLKVDGKIYLHNKVAKAICYDHLEEDTNDHVKYGIGAASATYYRLTEERALELSDVNNLFVGSRKQSEAAADRNASIAAAFYALLSHF
jgi:hypothetical protein